MGRSRRTFVSLARVATVAVFLVAGAAAPAWFGARAFADEATVSADTLRTGWDQNEPGLAPAQVASAGFGQLWSTAVDGQVYGQPVVAGSTVIVATENNNAYGLDAATGAVKWTVNFGPSWPASTIGCGDLVPNIGVTSTPVYDPGTGTVYLTAKVNDGADAQHPHYYLHALNAATGAELPGWPVTIAGSPSNDPSKTFNAYSELQRPGLLLMGGSVYAAFGGHCDLGPYAGYVVGVNTSTKAQSMWTDEAGSNSRSAGIWQVGGGLVSDGPGRIFFASGNGVSPGVAPGSSPPACWPNRWCGWQSPPTAPCPRKTSSARQTRPPSTPMTRTSAPATRSRFLTPSAPRRTRTCWSRQARTGGSSCLTAITSAAGARAAAAGTRSSEQSGRSRASGPMLASGAATAVMSTSRAQVARSGHCSTA